MTKYNCDVLVVGAGPSGLIAAAVAAQNGASVILAEKNDRLGVKLLLTGNGRCNLTHTETDIQKLTAAYGPNGKFLFKAFHRFGSNETMDFFQKLGVETKIEPDGRVFPQSGKAMDVLMALKRALIEYKVKIMINSPVDKLIRRGDKIEKIILKNKTALTAKKYIICAGGKSYPKTGSTGDAYSWITRLGHNIVAPRPALAPIICQEKFIKTLEGLSLKNAGFSLFQNNKKQNSIRADAIFTKNGLSGPAIFQLSKKISSLLTAGQVKIFIDLLPELPGETLDKELQLRFQKFLNKTIKNVLEILLPNRLVPLILELTSIAPDKKTNAITREERKCLAARVKNFDLTVKSLAGFDAAMITAGGVDLREVDPNTMRSKIIDNLYFAGEILDLDGPTGGYNLQVCWSTGFAAGNSSSL